MKEQVETPRGSSKSFFTAAMINFYIEFELFLRVNLTFYFWYGFFSYFITSRFKHTTDNSLFSTDNYNFWR